MRYQQEGEREKGVSGRGSTAKVGENPEEKEAGKNTIQWKGGKLEHRGNYRRKWD